MKLFDKPKVQHHPWERILVVDCAELEYFTYDCDINTPRVVVSATPEVQVRDFGDHAGITPFEINTIEQFTKLATETIVKAHEIAGKTFKTFYEADAYLTSIEVPFGNVLLSEHDANNKDVGETKKFLHSITHRYSDHYTLHQTFGFPGISNGVAYIVPDPEYLGVISTRMFKDAAGKIVDEWYGIGIINSLAVVKVEFGASSLPE